MLLHGQGNISVTANVAPHVPDLAHQLLLRQAMDDCLITPLP